ncbi:MAG: D-alanine--D-alanine ligase [Kiritimatiellae bacterium]|nr:D-alanine--D-alanine ligase [Kiritimatiellia bacterium]
MAALAAEQTVFRVKPTSPFSRVGVLMGGTSAERGVSLRSGASVAKGLTDAGYQVESLIIDSAELVVPDGIEAVFIALHGAFGEDGQIQRMLEEQKIPYTGSGPEASRRAFDKMLSKEIFTRAGLPTPQYAIVKRGEACPLPFPVVTKPVREGSSIGIHIVSDGDDWKASMEDTLRYGEAALVERYIPGRELTVGLVCDQVLPVIEIAPAEGYYNYDAKYQRKDTRYIVPADIPADAAARCRDLAVATFHALGCCGLSRVDFRMTSDSDLYILENNSIPGFTESSLLPKAARAAGMEFPELCDRIMRSAGLNKI